jgi:KDO2-lipid IV(A) lauroyltransferase
VPFRKRARRYLRYLGVLLLLRVTSWLPLAVAAALGEWAGGLGFVVAGRERAKALASLATAFPSYSQAERRELARQCFRHLGRSVGEMVCVKELDARRSELVDWPKEDRARMDAALARGKGVVFVTGHVGNWEVLARHVALEGYPAAVIGKETSDPHTTALVEAFRAAGKLRVIWRGGAGAAKEMLRTLRGNAILGLLIDQDTKVQSVWVPFFGHLAKTPRAAADLALRTGAVPMLGFAIRVSPGHYRISMHEVPLPEGEAEAAVKELTARLTLGIERVIREHPEQWVWMHERWKTPPPSEGGA